MEEEAIVLVLSHALHATPITPITGKSLTCNRTGESCRERSVASTEETTLERLKPSPVIGSVKTPPEPSSPESGPEYPHL